MKCYQCNNLAMYSVGQHNVPLCLDCFYKFSHVNQQQLENHERMLNYLEDEMSASVGLAPTGPRFPPRPKPLILAGTKLQNISVNNSVIGTINTGTIGSVDQSISVLQQTGEPEMAKAIKALSEAILQSGDLSPNQKNELVESLSVLAKEAATPKENRKNAVASLLLDRAIKVTDLANDIADACQKWWPILLVAFSSASA